MGFELTRSGDPDGMNLTQSGGAFGLYRREHREGEHSAAAPVGGPPAGGSGFMMELQRAEADGRA